MPELCPPSGLARRSTARLGVHQTRCGGDHHDGSRQEQSWLVERQTGRTERLVGRKQLIAGRTVRVVERPEPRLAERLVRATRHAEQEPERPWRTFRVRRIQRQLTDVRHFRLNEPERIDRQHLSEERRHERPLERTRRDVGFRSPRWRCEPYRPERPGRSQRHLGLAGQSRIVEQRDARELRRQSASALS